MALGGGNFTTQNKVLPGAYINVVSAARASAQLSDRGYCALALPLNWGPEGQVFTVTAGDLQKDSQKIFGYEYTHEALKPLRDLFRNASTAYLYRLGAGEKAVNEFATARYGGKRGNDIRIAIGANVDDTTQFDVSTLLGTVQVDRQTVTTPAQLVDNDFVCWKSDATLKATATTPLAGGANSEITGQDYQGFLDKIEAYSFNILGCVSTEKAVKDLFIAFTKRLRDQVGAKFQTVLHTPQADYEGVIALENQAAEGESALVCWVTGLQAGCPVNQSCTNRTYDGEYTVQVPHSQSQLEEKLKQGKFLMHRVGDQVRVLEDVNSLVTYSDSKGADFSSNQTLRVVDQIANDIAGLFARKYLGQVPNDADGRVALWSDIVSHHQQMQTIRAIEGFEADKITVAQGSSKRAVQLFVGGVQIDE